MGKSSRDKGARGERELIAELREWLGDLVPDRRLNAPRDGGEDLCVGTYCIEVKRQEICSIPLWWRQTCKQAKARGMIPALAYRQSRNPWRIVVPLQDGNHDLEYAATLQVPGFALLVREEARSANDLYIAMGKRGKTAQKGLEALPCA